MGPALVTSRFLGHQRGQLGAEPPNIPALNVSWPDDIGPRSAGHRESQDLVCTIVHTYRNTNTNGLYNPYATRLISPLDLWNL